MGQSKSAQPIIFKIVFLAYFQILKKYAIVRALSVRLSVRLSVCPSVPLLLFMGLTDWGRL
jgi:hypothetical protein